MDETQANTLLAVLEQQRNKTMNELAHMHVQVILLTNEVQQLKDKLSEKEG